MTSYEDVYWPVAILLALLLAWEAWDLTREVPRSGRKRGTDETSRQPAREKDLVSGGSRR